MFIVALFLFHATYCKVPSHPHSELVVKALTFVPLVKSSQVLVINDPEETGECLLQWGYSPDVIRDTIGSLRHLAEFTIDHHFPIFINAATYQYRRLELSWAAGSAPEQAARVLASDIYHEYRHAACGEEEEAALEAQIKLLKNWRRQGLLTIADRYIQAKEKELNEFRVTLNRRATVFVKRSH
jgi:hypothetical protein